MTDYFELIGVDIISFKFICNKCRKRLEFCKEKDLLMTEALLDRRFLKEKQSRNELKKKEFEKHDTNQLRRNCGKKSEKLRQNLHAKLRTNCLPQ